MEPVNLNLGLEGSHVMITGGAGFIGSMTVSAFLSAGAKVTCVDNNKEAISRLLEWLKEHFHTFPESAEIQCVVADISEEDKVNEAFKSAAGNFGPISCCIALASLDLSYLAHQDSITDMPFDQWKHTFSVNVHGTFLTAKAWLKQFKNYSGPRLSNVSLIIVGSESGLFGERSNPDYAAGKSAVQLGLLQSLKADVPRVYSGARVNAIAPGPVSTPQFEVECEQNPEQYWLDAQATTAMGKPVSMRSVARSMVFLASEFWSGSIHGQILQVDCGKQGKVMWTKEELEASGNSARTRFEV